LTGKFVDVFVAEAGDVELSAIDPSEVTLEYRGFHVRQSDLLLFALSPALRAAGGEEFGFGTNDFFVDEEHFFSESDED
jgi:hypothetical protein